MSNIWVVKDDGTRQCDERNKGTPLEVTADELKQLGATVLDSEKRQDCRVIPRVCGAPTGQLNAHKISRDDWEKIKSGIIGPLGFREWTCDEDLEDTAVLAGGEIPWPFVNRMLLATSASSAPVLIRELIGRESRYYEDGSIITEDFRPERVNIVTEKGTNIIKEIWFG